MIEVKNLSKAYDKNLVLDNIDLRLADNRIYGLVGRNGVGKTTLMKILSELIINYQGDIFVDGVNIKKDKSFKENMVIIGNGLIGENENPSKLKSLTTTFKTLSPNFNEHKYEELMETFKLKEKTKYNKLSYGNKALYHSIIGLSSGAKVIFLDEPANGLDEINRDKFYQKLLDYQAEDESLIMVSSHILSDIERVVTDIIFLADSKIVLNEPVENLEEKAYMITIDEANLKLLDNKNILTYKKVANKLVVTVYDGFTHDELLQLKSKAIISSMNLHELFKALNKEA